MITLLIIITISWRLFSKRKARPCPTWLAKFVEMDNPLVKLGKAKNIIINADIQENMIILDAGCGPGRITIPASKKVGTGGHVIALDVQLGMLDRASKKAEKENLTNITFFQAGLGEKKLEHNKFDRVLLVMVLGEIPNQKEALQEIFHALKPNGILSITETIFDPHFQKRSKVVKLASTFGFKEKARFGNGIAFTINFEKL